MGNAGLPLAESLDLGWVLICTALVLVMQAGFCCLETGFVRSKNRINVAIKNLADVCLSGTVFWVVGFGLMFGSTYGGYVGTSNFLFAGGEASVLAFFLFQLVFCSTAVTIISGAVAERVRFTGYLLIALLVSAVLYPVFGHWAWSGAQGDGPAGWLAQLGFIDFAGSTVVHSVGGWTALAAAIVVGPRRGRFGPTRGGPIPGHNLPMAALGTLLLFFGWFGFNGGSTLGVTDVVPLILVNTALAGLTAGCAALALSWSAFGNPRPSHANNGILAGLVAITASCHLVTPVGAVCIGISLPAAS